MPLSLTASARVPAARLSVTSALAITLRPIALIGLAAGALTTRADPDLWGHVRFGLDILAAGRVSPVDAYSFTKDRPWINHEWLSETIMGASYRVGGVAGLVVLKALLALAIFGLAWHAMRSLRSTWRWAGLAIAAWGMLPLVSTLRPQLWTGLLLVAVCRVLISSSIRALWWLPLIFALWANLHGGWIVGGELLLLWTIAAWLQQSPRRWPLLAVGVASLGATLLNPYGWNLWIFLAETVRFGRDHISEWQPVWEGGSPMVWLWGLGVAVVAVSWWHTGRPSTAVLCGVIALAIAGARVARLEPLFVLATVILLSSEWPAADSSDAAQPGLRVFLDVCAMAITIAAALSAQVLPHCIAAPESGPDMEAGESLANARGHLVTSFNWGEYVIWHFGPALQVSIDGRRETLYTDRTVSEQLGIAFGDPSGIAALARIAPEYVWLPASAHAAAGWLRQHGYREDVRTDRSFVAVRADLPPLHAWRGTASQCFPGP